MFFTSAFTGDFAQRLDIIDQICDIVKSISPDVAKLIRAVSIYFQPFVSGMASRQKEKLKKVKQKFEVAVKAGKLFEEEKLRQHYKETTKVRRDTSLQILKILKEPAMKYSFDRKGLDEKSDSEFAIQTLFNFGTDLPTSTFIFSSDCGKPIGGISDLSTKAKKLLQKMVENFEEKALINEELKVKRAQIAALQRELKKSVSQDQKCKFHPTQKAIGNMLADLRLYGLRPLYGAKFELQTISLLSELYVSLCGTSNVVDQVKKNNTSFGKKKSCPIFFFFFLDHKLHVLF